MADIPAFLNSVFPATKLHLPGSQDTVRRTSLIEQLRQLVLSHRLTLISAPAGSGKTTLAADFSRSASGCDVRWLSLDEEDNSLKSFSLGVVLAMLPSCDDDLIPVVAQGAMPSRQIANALINRLDESRDQTVVLALDDLHLVTDLESHAFLDYLIERLPAHVHVLVTTRYDPPLALPKLRARGDLAELRLDALRFNRSEVSELLNHVLRLNIPQSLVNQMVERTEGWIAGLRLLALSLERIDSVKRAQYIEGLAQKDRYVFDLLAEEVLSQQRPDIRRFLLETSILDELTPERCAAVTQQPEAGEKLLDLHRHNLFLVSVGDGTYRYHALFREFLREQLKRTEPQTLKELHRRAANTQTERGQKLEHLIAAEQWGELSETIRQTIREGIHQLFTNTHGANWVRAIERIPIAQQEADPWLILARGSLAFDRGDYRVSNTLLEAAYQRMKECGDEDGAFLARVYLLVPQIELSGSAIAVDELIDLFDTFIPDQSPIVQVSLLQAKLWGGAVGYRHAEVESVLVQLIDKMIATQNNEVFQAFAQSIGSALLFTRLGASPFDRVLPIMKRYMGGDKSIVRMGVANIEGLLMVFRGDVDGAWTNAQTAREIINYYGGFAWADAVVDQVIVAVCLNRRNYTEMDSYFQQRNEQMTSLESRKQILPELLYLYAKRLLDEGKLNDARNIAAQMEPTDTIKEHEVVRLALRGHIARREGKPDEAVQWMEQAAALHPTFRSSFPTHAPLGLALAYWEADERADAFRALRDALQPLVEWNYPGIVLMEGRDIVPLLQAAADRGIYADFCRFCLSIFGADRDSRTIDIPGSTEALTPREVDILRLAVNGASNRDIAETLVISENTVKSHLTRILGKLGAKSRTEAAARVRELNLPL